MYETDRQKDGALYRVIKAGGREFPVYYAFYEDIGYCIPQYPDFEENPEYDDDGRPFASSPQEGCEHALPTVEGEEFAGDCGDCRFFLRNERAAVIGVCNCDMRRRPRHNKEEL